MDTPNNTSSRRCTKCGKEYPATREFFYIAKRGRLSSRCKKCTAERMAKWRSEQERPIKRNKLSPAAAEHRREYMLRYYAEHREELTAGYRQLYKEKAEERREYRRRYCIANPDKIRAEGFRRRARILENGGTHTDADIRLQIKAQTDKRGKLHCWWCGKTIKGNQYHVDHKIPLKQGGGNGAENLVISCPTCNLSKNGKTPAEFNGRLL